MVESTTLLVLILEIVVIVVFLIVMFKGAKTYIRRRKVNIKTPKIRGRNVLIDKRFGSALGVGYTPMGIGDRVLLHLLGRDGHFFKIPYQNDEIYPENPTQAFAGAQTSIWRVKGQAYSDAAANTELLKSEQRNAELVDKLKETKVQSKIAVNESSTLKDTVLELVKELKEPQKAVEVKAAK